MSDEEALLQPGEQTEHTVPIYFGEDGWTFPEPGEYEVRARLQTGSDTPDALSTDISITIARPQSEADQAALRPLIGDGDRLDDASGRLLVFGGRIGAERAGTRLEAAVEQTWRYVSRWRTKADTPDASLASTHRSTHGRKAGAGFQRGSRAACRYLR